MLLALLRSYRSGRIILAGIAAGCAYLLAQAIDLRIFKVNSDDVQLLGRFFSPHPPVWKTIGTLLHFANSINLAVLYSLIGRLLPGPGWLRGLIFTMIENTGLWPLVLIIDRVHPGRKAGTLAAYNAPIPFIQGIVRHVAYGVVLGWLCPLQERATRQKRGIHAGF